MIEQAIVVAGDDPLRRVAGLPLLERTLLTLARAGVRRAWVLGEALPARTGLEATLVRSIDVVKGPVLVVPPDRVFEPELARRAAGADLSAAGAWTTGDCGIVAARSVDDAAGPARPLAIDGLFWHDVGTPEKARAAEAGLFRRLRKSVDGPISRHVNRPMSLRVTRLLIDTRVTPNQMSVVAGLIGVAGAVIVYASQSYAALILGAALLNAQSILDGCDGEIARLKFQASRLGEWIDNGTDDFLNILYCGALGVASARLVGWPFLFWVGLAGAVGYAVFMIVLNYQLVTVHRSGNPFAFRWWFHDDRVDPNATVSKPGAGELLRTLGRRELMMWAFMLLAIAHLPALATLWYAAIGLSNFGAAATHVALGGVAAARRAEASKR